MTTTADQARALLSGKTIWLWHYMHSDWQWEQSRAWHTDRYALAVQEVLDLMQRDPDLMYFFDTESEYWEPVARQLGPRLEELKQRVREGRVRIASAQVANCRPTQTADETYLRNLQLGREFFTANVPPTDLSLFHSVDIAIGGIQMPQVLALAGFKYYRAWRPHGPMNAHRIPHQFYWEAPDGSRVLVTRGAYGGLFTHAPAFDAYAQDWDAAMLHVFNEFFDDQLLANRSPSDQLWMIIGSDDARPLRRHDDDNVDLPGFLAEWRKREAVPIRWCTPLEYSQAVAEHAEDLTVIKGVLDGCDVGYNAANSGANGLWRWRQMNDRRLLRAEWWVAAAAVTTGYPARRDELKRLWRQHLTYQAHAQEACFADDFNELIDLARDVRFHAERIEREALTALAQAAGGGQRTTQYIFNPHPWPVQADVELYHACAVGGIESLEVVDEVGNPLPQQRLSEFRHPRFSGKMNDQHRLVRVTLPPMGYRRVTLMEKAEVAPADLAAPSGGALQAAGLSLTYRNHALREVRDANGVLYLARDGAPWPNLWFHVLDNQDWLFYGPETRRIAFEPSESAWLHYGPLRWQHRSQGMLGPYQARIDTIVGERERELQVRVRLEGHWDKAPMTGFVTLLADIAAGGEVTVDTPFIVEPRDPDHEYYVTNPPRDQGLGDLGMFERLRPGYFWGRSWADWSDAGRGFTLLSADGAYYWFKEPGALGHVVLRALASKPGTWEEFSADVWTGAGVHEFNYAYRFHDGVWRQADPQRRAQELRHPPVVARPNYPTQPVLADGHSFVELSANALLSAYYVEDDAAFVRIYERDGKGSEVTLTLDWAPASAQVVDLLGAALDTPVQLAGQRVVVTLRPWQIATLRLARKA